MNKYFFFIKVKLLEYYEGQKPQVHTKLHVQRSFILKSSTLEK